MYLRHADSIRLIPEWRAFRVRMEYAEQRRRLRRGLCGFMINGMEIQADC